MSKAFDLSAVCSIDKSCVFTSAAERILPQKSKRKASLLFGTTICCSDGCSRAACSCLLLIGNPLDGRTA